MKDEIFVANRSMVLVTLAIQVVSFFFGLIFVLWLGMRILCLFLYALPLASLAQTINVQSTDSLAIDAEQFVGIDSFGSLYSLQANELFKQQGSTFYNYNNVQLGELGSIDLLNPLEITLFYPDFNTVIQLDNTLNEINRVDFNTLPDFKIIKFARTAIDKSLWVFDENTQQLEVFNFKDQSFTVINQPIPDNVIDMTSNYNFCWLLTARKIYQFNIYGSLLNTWENKGWKQLSQHRNDVLAYNDSDIVLIQDDGSEPIAIPVEEKPIKQLQLTNETLYIYRESTLHTLQLQLPKKEE